MDTRDAVIEILEQLCPGVDCDSCMTLIDDRYLTSLTMVALVADLEDEFDIEVSPVYVVPENFNSADAITALVEQLQEDA